MTNTRKSKFRIALAVVVVVVLAVFIVGLYTTDNSFIAIRGLIILPLSVPIMYEWGWFNPILPDRLRHKSKRAKQKVAGAEVEDDEVEGAIKQSLPKCNGCGKLLTTGRKVCPKCGKIVGL